MSNFNYNLESKIQVSNINTMISDHAYWWSENWISIYIDLQFNTNAILAQTTKGLHIKDIIKGLSAPYNIPLT